ncbi:hypothetical protein [Pyrococcus woesei]|uniref:hypothetical protein n=1 Tax=Pyrococcus woesei TaxID=2262 RepID=UPI003D2F3A41
MEMEYGSIRTFETHEEIGSVAHSMTDFDKIREVWREVKEYIHPRVVGVFSLRDGIFSEIYVIGDVENNEEEIIINDEVHILFSIPVKKYRTPEDLILELIPKLLDNPLKLKMPFEALLTKIVRDFDTALGIYFFLSGGEVVFEDTLPLDKIQDVFASVTNGRYYVSLVGNNTHSCAFFEGKWRIIRDSQLDSSGVYVKVWKI